jgi:hypothetical protein
MFAQIVRGTALERAIRARHEAGAVVGEPLGDRAPKGATTSAYVHGLFHNDTNFDGSRDPTPDGILYIVAGGGGTTLNKTPIKDNLEDLPDDGRDNFAPFNATTFATDNSFVLLETSGPRLTLRALDSNGREVDRVAIDKH